MSFGVDLEDAEVGQEATDVEHVFVVFDQEASILTPRPVFHHFVGISFLRRSSKFHRRFEKGRPTRSQPISQFGLW